MIEIEFEDDSLNPYREIVRSNLEKQLNKPKYQNEIRRRIRKFTREFFGFLPKKSGDRKSLTT